MHRALITPIAAALVLALTLAVAWGIGQNMETGAQAASENLAKSARGQFDAALKERGFELMAEAQSFSNSADVAATFSHDPIRDRQGRLRDGYVAVQGFAAALKERYEGRSPEVVLILDRDGNTVVRNEDENFNHVGDHLETSEPSAKLAVDDALAGKVNFDVWNFDGKMVLAATSPVYGATLSTGERPVIGATVIGFALSKELAESDANLFNASVAYFLDGKVQSTYFLRERREDPDLANSLTPYVKDANLSNGTLFAVKGLGGDDYVGVATRLPDLSRHSGAVLLVDVTTASEPANHAAIAVGVIGLLALLVLLGAQLLQARSFLAGIDDVETGLEQIIAGNTEYMLRTRSRDLEGTANALNVMLARLIPGRPEGDEDESEGGSRMAQVSVDEVDAASVSQAQGGQVAVDPETLRLAQEPEQEYFKRLFGEYTAAKKGRGEDVSDQTFESFVAKLRLSEGSLRKKYSCRAVRFRVLTREGQVTLKPVPIY